MHSDLSSIKFQVLLCILYKMNLNVTKLCNACKCLPDGQRCTAFEKQDRGLERRIMRTFKIYLFHWLHYLER